MWKCDQCGEEVGDDLVICSNCKTGRDNSSGVITADAETGHQIDANTPAVGESTNSIVMRFKSWMRTTSLSDKIQLLIVIVGTGTLILVYIQLRVNDATNRVAIDTNRVAIRGQLYQSDFSLVNDEVSDDEQSLMTIWTVVPPEITNQDFARTLIKLVSEDSTAQEAKTVEELYKSMFGVETFADPKRRKATSQLRRVFLHIQNTFYHVHNAHDYHLDGILKPDEWKTWKGYIREMNAHPLLLAVIWNGYQQRYFSAEFGKFIQQEVCADSVPDGDTNPDAYKRGKEFVRFYYPEMLRKEWPDALPAY